MDLLVSGRDDNSIEILVYHMTKRADSWACGNTFDAQACPHISINNHSSVPGVPQEIVSDHNAGFPPDYWKEVARILRTMVFMSVGNHPGTDVHCDNSHNIFESVSGNFSTHNQATWDKYISLVKYAFNYSKHCSVKQTQFFRDPLSEPL
jgi:hypothetical protein